MSVHEEIKSNNRPWIDQVHIKKKLNLIYFILLFVMGVHYRNYIFYKLQINRIIHTIRFPNYSYFE